VPTPQPPLEDERLAVRLVHPGVSTPRPAHRPGPRPRTERITARPEDDFGPSLSVRADLPDAREAGRRLITCTLEALAGRRPFRPGAADDLGGGLRGAVGRPAPPVVR
jgi:hypothetical protein